MKATILFSLVLAGAAAAEATIRTPAAQSRLVLKASNVLLSPGKAIPRGVIVIEEGKIAAVGTDLGAPQGSRVMDFGNATICAGFVNCHASTGVENEVTDTTEAFTPGVRAADAFLAGKRAQTRAACEGITCVALSPDGKNVLSGVAALAKNGSAARLVREDLYLKGSLSRAALQDDRYPTSLAEGISHLTKLWKEAGVDPAKVKNPELKNLARARKDKTFRAWVDVQDAESARQLIVLAKDYNFAPVVVATGDLTEVAGELANAKIPVVLPALTPDSSPRARRAPAIYARAGCEVAFCTMATSEDFHPSALRTGAVLAAANGLDKNVAFAAITTTPAKLLGYENQGGSIAAGRDADLCVFADPGMSGPMNLCNSLEAVFVDGELCYRRER
jgi:imidazolonepropionase-like amidohydrolase